MIHILFYLNPDLEKTRRKSGGLAIIVRNNLLKYCTSIDSQCEYIQWLKIYKTVFRSNEDVIFGNVYVPPIDSPYFENDEFAMFSDEIINKARDNKHVPLIGDFNARVGNLDEFVILDECNF